MSSRGWGGVGLESYLYDADGQRIKKTVTISNTSITTTTTFFISPLFEKSGATTTKYFYFNGQRVAMRINGVLQYLHADHLGSTVLTTNAATNASVIGDEGYLAYGRNRRGTGVPTDHKFTGQKQDGSGLQYFNARYFDPQVGVFISPDSIVPDPTNVFDHNRFMYVRGRVMNMNDPSGHDSAQQGQEQWRWRNRWYNARGYFHDPITGHWTDKRDPAFHDQAARDEVLQDAGVEFDAGSPWLAAQIQAIATGIVRLGQALGSARQGLARLQNLLGPGAHLYLSAAPAECLGAPACALMGVVEAATGRYPVRFDSNQVGAGQYFDTPLDWTYTIVHELAHVIDWNSGATLSRDWIVNLPLTNYANCQAGCEQQWENWAEAVTVWVFGQPYLNYAGYGNAGVVGGNLADVLQQGLDMANELR